MNPRRCRGRTCWTSHRCGSWMHRRRYPSTQSPPAAHSCLPRSVLWTYCTRPSTSRCCYVTASQTSTYSGRSASVDWAGRCRASSRPRTIEEVGPVDVLLDQQRDAGSHVITDIYSPLMQWLTIFIVPCILHIMSECGSLFPRLSAWKDAF